MAASKPDNTSGTDPTVPQLAQSTTALKPDHASNTNHTNALFVIGTSALYSASYYANDLHVSNIQLCVMALLGLTK